MAGESKEDLEVGRGGFDWDAPADAVHSPGDPEQAAAGGGGYWSFVALVTVHYLDIVTDIGAAVVFAVTGHSWWSYLCITFLLLGPGILAVWRLVSVVKSRCTPNKLGWRAWLMIPSSLLHIDSMLSVYHAVQEGRKSNWQTSLLDDLDANVPMGLSIHDHKFFEALLQSLPQVALQGYALLVLRLSSLAEISGWLVVLQAASVILSLLSISGSLSVVRIAWQEDLEMRTGWWAAGVFGWTFAEVSLKVLGLAYTAAAIRLYVGAVVAAGVIAKGIFCLCTLRKKPKCDILVYLLLSLFVWFPLEDGGRTYKQRLMFGIDTLMALVLIVLPMAPGVQPRPDDPLAAGGELIAGLCPQQRNGCTGFPLSYFITYCCFAVGVQVGFWVHELGLLLTANRNARKLVQAAPCCFRCCSRMKCCRGLVCGPGGMKSEDDLRAEKIIQAIGSSNANARRLSGSSNGSRATYTNEEHQRHKRTHKRLRKHRRRVKLTEGEDDAEDCDSDGSLHPEGSGRDLLTSSREQVQSLPTPSALPGRILSPQVATDAGNSLHVQSAATISGLDMTVASDGNQPANSRASQSSDDALPSVVEVTSAQHTSPQHTTPRARLAPLVNSPSSTLGAKHGSGRGLLVSDGTSLPPQQLQPASAEGDSVMSQRPTVDWGRGGNSLFSVQQE